MCVTTDPEDPENTGTEQSYNASNGNNSFQVIANRNFDPSKMECIVSLEHWRNDIGEEFESLIREGYVCYSVTVLSNDFAGDRRSKLIYTLAKKRGD